LRGRGAFELITSTQTNKGDYSKTNGLYVIFLLRSKRDDFQMQKQRGEKWSVKRGKKEDDKVRAEADEFF
jgi:hypothetical protein